MNIVIMKKVVKEIKTVTNPQNTNNRFNQIEDAIQGLINVAREQQGTINGFIETDRRLQERQLEIIQQQQSISRDIQTLFAGIDELYQIVNRRERNNE